MPLYFEWSPVKAAANIRKHGVTFGEAATVFSDRLSITIPDVVHSQEEDRFVTIGLSEMSRLLVVVHTDRGNSIRIITARKATSKEQRQYEEGTNQEDG